MKKNIFNFVTVTFLMTAVLAFATVFTSCKKDEEKKEDPSEEPIITIVDSIPENILPSEIRDIVATKINIFKGDNPPELNGQYRSKPHALLYASYDTTYHPEDSTIFFSDRYVAFFYSEVGGLDFYGKQWDPESQEWVNEHRLLQITGNNHDFCCFYALEARPHGFLLRQSTIFSGTLTAEGIKDFKVAVVMVENDGDEEFYPKNTFRILGDFDGMAAKHTWIEKKLAETSGGQLDSFIK